MHQLLFSANETCYMLLFYSRETLKNQDQWFLWFCCLQALFTYNQKGPYPPFAFKVCILYRKSRMWFGGHM